MTLPNTVGRRTFVKTTTAAAAGLTLYGMMGPASARALGANERINTGHVGVGGQGTGLLKRVVRRTEREADVQVIAVCDLYNRRKTRAKEAARLSDSGVYHDYRELLERDDIDAVFIAAPDHWHAPVAIDAMKSGKDIYLEKPMTLTVEEAKEVYEASVKYGRIHQGGASGASSPWCWTAKEAIEQGLIGKVIWSQTSYSRNNPEGEWNWGIDKNAGPKATGEDYVDWRFWLGPARRRPWSPDRFFRFRKFWDYSGGIATDLMYHRLTPLHIAFGNGFPKRVVGTGGIFYCQNIIDPTTGLPDVREVPDTFTVNADYWADHSVNIPSSLVNDTGVPTIIRGNEADLYPEQNGIRIVAQSAYKKEFVQKHGKEEIVIEAQPREDHMGHFFSCMRTREQPALNALVAYQVMCTIGMSVESYKNGRHLDFDEKRERVTTRPFKDIVQRVS
ncbi:MAG: Gfo/Idh/MocA family oxidoreductase [bacterium]